MYSMDFDANDAPQHCVGGREPSPFTDAQPGAFLAALDEHRAQVGAAHPLAILIIRLDRFQHACDTIGSRRASILRAQVKSRVAGVGVMPAVMHWLGPADLGIACLLPEGADGTSELSLGIASALAPPYVIDGFEVFLSCSIGAAIDRPESATERNLQQAFDAMLQINRRGGDGIGNASQPVSPRLTTLLAALPDAVSRGEFGLQLQPRALLRTAEVVAYTVRLRWHHPVLGRIAPQDFLPAIESLGMMLDVSRWLVQQLLQLMRETDVAANVQFNLLAAGPLLQADDTIFMLRRAVEAAGIRPARLCVEVPVGSVVDAPETTQKAARLHEAGIQIALADFGNDPASRRALALVTPDAVMLDARHLGSAGGAAANAASALQAACKLAKSHGAAVYARGVETWAQLEAVRSWGCDGMQGYLLAQPFPAHWLAQTHAAVAARARMLLGTADTA